MLLNNQQIIKEIKICIEMNENLQFNLIKLYILPIAPF